MKISQVVTTDNHIEGDRITLQELLGKPIVIEKIIIEKSKFKDHGDKECLSLQICFPEFTQEPDEQGDSFVKGPDGHPIGERRCVFTGSEVLIKKAKEMSDNCSKLGRDKNHLNIECKTIKIKNYYTFTSI